MEMDIPTTSRSLLTIVDKLVARPNKSVDTYDIVSKILLQIIVPKLGREIYLVYVLVLHRVLSLYAIILCVQTTGQTNCYVSNKLGILIISDRYRQQSQCQQ